MMRGLCYSALSYAPLFIDRTTVVIGDGDLAIRSSAELATIAKQVHLICETGNALASPLGKKLVASDNVSILKQHEVVEVRGDDFARAVILKDPEGKLNELQADGTFIEMALIPNSQMVADLVELDEQGRIIVDCANRTNVPGFSPPAMSLLDLPSKCWWLSAKALKPPLARTITCYPCSDQ